MFGEVRHDTNMHSLVRKFSKKISMLSCLEQPHYLNENQKFGNKVHTSFILTTKLNLLIVRNFKNTSMTWVDTK